MQPQDPPEPQNTPPRISRRNTLFFGPDGLRAGWGCLLFLFVLAVLGFVANVLAGMLIHHAHPMRGAPVAAKWLLLSESISLGAVVAATLVMARYEHRSLRSYGLAAVAVLPRAVGGWIAGFAAISALVGALWAAHLLALGRPTLPAGAALKDGLLWALAFLLVGCFEELLLRGYLLFTLTRGIRFWPAAIVLSVAFGFIHRSNPGETPVGLFSAGAVGLVLCLSIWYTGSLWWAIGFHAAWDWGESFFWSTSDSGMMVQGHLLTEHPFGNRLLSGGATGPEGSLLIFPLLMVCALLMVLWWRRRPVLPALPAAAPLP